MKHALVVLAIAGVAWSAGPPAIRPEGVINAASLAPSLSPGGAIARGSIFRILGDGLGPEKPAHDGVSVRLRGGGAILDAQPVYASASRIDAVLPASAPLGELLLTVVYNGLESAPFPVQVTETSFGIFTQNGEGWGPANDGSAAPGASITIRGTGLGRERKPEILIAGHRAIRIHYAGPGKTRTGEDEIRFELPRHAPQGCSVPIQVQTGGVWSNVATIAIVAKGRPCVSTAPWLSSGSLLLLLRTTVQSAPFGNLSSDLMIASFAPQSGELAPLRALPPPGACAAYGRTYSSEEINGLIHVRQEDYPDAGWIAISGPGGTKSIARWPRGPFSYWGPLGGGMGRRKPPPLFLEPGAYNVAGPGGRQIGPFHAQVTVPQPLEWTNRGQITEVSRRQDLAIAWAGAGDNELAIVIAGNVDLFTGSIEMCACLTPAATGHLVVPAAAMANLLNARAGGAQPLGIVALALLPAKIAASGPVTAAYASLDVRLVSFH